MLMPAFSPVVTNPILRSLDFEDSSLQSLSMSDANYGNFTRNKWAIAGAFNCESLTDPSGYVITARHQDNTTREYTLFVRAAGAGVYNLSLVTYNTGGSTNGIFIGSTALSTATWYSFLIHYDEDNGTSGSRIKMWIRNSAETSSSYTTPTGDMVDKNVATYVGRNQNSGNELYFDGKIYSLAFFNNVLPTAAQVFDGATGRLNNLSLISGIYSILDVAGNVVTHDGVVATAWTNNNTVVSSTTIPT